MYDQHPHDNECRKVSVGIEMLDHRCDECTVIGNAGLSMYKYVVTMPNGYRILCNRLDEVFDIIEDLSDDYENEVFLNDGRE